MQGLFNGLTLFWDNIGWALINIAVPGTLPAAGLLLARLMPLRPAERARTRLVTTIEDGQLGWLALAWSATATYEAWQHMASQGRVFTWVALLLACEAALVLTAMFIAAGGAVSEETAANRKSRVGGSIIVACASAMIFVATHLKTLS